MTKGKILGEVRGEPNLARGGGSAPSFVSGVTLGRQPPVEDRETHRVAWDFCKKAN